MNPSQRPQRFQWLYERHFRLVWSVVGQLGLAGAAREDAVQEIWLTIYRRLDTLDAEASSRAWVCSISRKVVWRLRRNAQRRDRRVSAYASEPTSNASCAARRVEVTAEVEEALAALSEDQRAVLVMANVHGLTAPEISTTLGLPVNTVYSRLRLARRRLEPTAAREPDVRTALDAGDRPPERMRGYIWALLQPGIAKPAILGAASTWGTAKAVALGMALGGAGVAAIVLPAQSSQDAPSVVASAADASPPSRTTQAVASSVAAKPEVAEPVALAEPVDAEPVAVVPQPKAIAKPRGRATTEPSVVAEGRAAAPAADAAPDLAAEAQLLRRAQQKLKAGAPAEALRLLQQHEQSFGNGALADVRDGAMVRALCSLNRTEQAVRIAGRLKSGSPDSPVASAIAGGATSPCITKSGTEKAPDGDGSGAVGR